MAKENTSLGDWNKKGWVEKDGKLVRADSLVDKKIDKIEPYQFLGESSKGLSTFVPRNGQLVGTDEPGIPMFNIAPMRVEISGGTYSINGSSHTNLPGSVNVGDAVSVKKNVKIKNATKTVIDGISFDSRLEAHLYGLLKGAGIAFEFQKVYWLMENFKYRGETIRGIKIIMDFWLPTRNILIDSKGWQTYDGKLKHKMLKQHLKTVENNEPEILMPSTKKECDLLLNKLLYGTA